MKHDKIIMHDELSRRRNAETLMTELSHFSQLYGDYSMRKFILPSENEISFCLICREKITEIKIPEFKMLIEEALLFLEGYYLFDNLEEKVTPQRQRALRSKVLFALGDYYSNEANHSKKLSLQKRIFYKKIYDFMSSNRLRRGKIIPYLEIFSERHIYFEGFEFESDTITMFNNLTAKEFHAAPDGKMCYVYDYLSDAEKTVVVKYFSKFLEKYVRDIFSFSFQQ